MRTRHGTHCPFFCFHFSLEIQQISVLHGVCRIRDGARRSQTRHGLYTASLCLFLLRPSSFLNVSALSPTNEPAATGSRRDRYHSSFTSFTGEDVKGGEAHWIAAEVARCCVVHHLPRESKYASAGRSRASHTGSAHTGNGNLVALTIASFFSLRDELKRAGLMACVMHAASGCHRPSPSCAWFSYG
jgi:hypothetical protein